MLVLYSDGVSEAQTVVFDEFGPDRLADIVERERDRARGRSSTSIVASIDAFVEGAPQFDDITLMVDQDEPRRTQNAERRTPNAGRRRRAGNVGMPIDGSGERGTGVVQSRVGGQVDMRTRTATCADAAVGLVATLMTAAAVAQARCRRPRPPTCRSDGGVPIAVEIVEPPRFGIGAARPDVPRGRRATCRARSSWPGAPRCTRRDREARLRPVTDAS